MGGFAPSCASTRTRGRAAPPVGPGASNPPRCGRPGREVRGRDWRGGGRGRRERLRERGPGTVAGDAGDTGPGRDHRVAGAPPRRTRRPAGRHRMRRGGRRRRGAAARGHEPASERAEARRLPDADGTHAHRGAGPRPAGERGAGGPGGPRGPSRRTGVPLAPCAAWAPTAPPSRSVPTPRCCEASRGFGCTPPHGGGGGRSKPGGCGCGSSVPGRSRPCA